MKHYLYRSKPSLPTEFQANQEYYIYKICLSNSANQRDAARPRIPPILRGPVQLPNYHRKTHSYAMATSAAHATHALRDRLIIYSPPPVAKPMYTTNPMESAHTAADSTTNEGAKIANPSDDDDHSSAVYYTGVETATSQNDDDNEDSIREEDEEDQFQAQDANQKSHEDPPAPAAETVHTLPPQETHQDHLQQVVEVQETQYQPLPRQPRQWISQQPVALPNIPHTNLHHIDPNYTPRNLPFNPEHPITMKDLNPYPDLGRGPTPLYGNWYTRDPSNALWFNCQRCHPQATAPKDPTWTFSASPFSQVTHARHLLASSTPPSTDLPWFHHLYEQPPNRHFIMSKDLKASEVHYMILMKGHTIHLTMHTEGTLDQVENQNKLLHLVQRKCLEQRMYLSPTELSIYTWDHSYGFQYQTLNPYHITTATFYVGVKCCLMLLSLVVTGHRTWSDLQIEAYFQQHRLTHARPSPGPREQDDQRNARSRRRASRRQLFGDHSFTTPPQLPMPTRSLPMNDFAALETPSYLVRQQQNSNITPRFTRYVHTSDTSSSSPSPMKTPVQVRYVQIRPPGTMLSPPQAHEMESNFMSNSQPLLPVQLPPQQPPAQLLQLQQPSAQLPHGQQRRVQSPSSPIDLYDSAPPDAFVTYSS